MESQEEIVRLLVMQIRPRFETQAEAIREFGKAGFSANRIAELLGTTPGTAKDALAKGKQAQAKKGSKATRKVRPT